MHYDKISHIGDNFTSYNYQNLIFENIFEILNELISLLNDM